MKQIQRRRGRKRCHEPKPGAEAAKVGEEVENTKAMRQSKQSQARKAQPTPASQGVRCKAMARRARSYTDEPV